MFGDPITTSSWEDGMSQLKTVLRESNEYSMLSIYSSKKLVPDMYKKNPDIKVIILCDSKERPYSISDCINILRSMLTTWYDKHEEMDEDEDDCNIRPIIHSITKLSFDNNSLKSILKFHKEGLTYPLYEKGIWYCE